MKAHTRDHKVANRNIPTVKNSITEYSERAKSNSRKQIVSHALVSVGARFLDIGVRNVWTSEGGMKSTGYLCSSMSFRAWIVQRRFYVLT